MFCAVYKNEQVLFRCTFHNTLLKNCFILSSVPWNFFLKNPPKKQIFCNYEIEDTYKDSKAI